MTNGCAAGTKTPASTPSKKKKKHHHGRALEEEDVEDAGRKLQTAPPGHHTKYHVYGAYYCTCTWPVTSPPS
jgi:hypothetical protein